MSRFAELRRMMVDCQLRPSEVTDPAVIAAADSLPREVFVSAAREAQAYSDNPVKLDDENPQRMLLAPMVVARMVQALALRDGQSALEYAGGTGYGAAMMAVCGAEVTLSEADESLRQKAAVALEASGKGHVSVVAAVPATQFDAILVNGACEQRPQPLLDVLKPGGRLVAIEGIGRSAKVMLYQRNGDEVSGRAVFDAAAPLLDEFRKPAEFAF
ncbi:MAG: protein-L-isoaspartate O-methyltransferase family protein [Bosea sp. (in: a-proteobacteria)]